MYRKAANNGVGGQENPLPYTPIEDSDISRSTNRFATGTTYDDAGNVTTDNKFRTMGFGYDANGRMVKATKTSVPDALSVYDASGMRVAEKVNDVWRFLVYDIGGKLVTEYGGLQASDEGGIKYLLSDWQGSTRAVLSNTGVVNGRADYTAFGEDIGSGTGLRTVTQGFGNSNNPRQKYGLTERDDATGMDHTPWRKHENRAGRWTGADPYGGSMSIGDPQSFNRYSYVQSQPTNFIDPSGLNLAGSNTHYGPFDPMGIAYYLDGMLSDARTVWGVLGAGGGWIEYSNVSGLSYTTYGHRDEQERYFRDSQTIHYWSVSEAVGGDDDCLTMFGTLDIKCQLRKDRSQSKSAARRTCLKLYYDSAKMSFADLQKSWPLDESLTTAMGVAGLAAGASAGGDPRAKALAFAGGAVAAGTQTFTKRLVGYFAISNFWSKKVVEECGVLSKHVPQELDPFLN